MARPRTFKKGAAILSIHLQVPIVPVAIEGFHDAWPRGQRFQKFAPLKIQIGDPIYPPPEAEASEAAYEKLTAELKARVVECGMGCAASKKRKRHIPDGLRLLLFLTTEDRRLKTIWPGDESDRKPEARA